MSDPRRADLTTGSIPGHLIKLSVPMIWGILSIVSMQLFDVYFIGQLGHTELAAISFTFPVSMVVFNLVMGLSIATASITARLIGAGDTEGMKHFTLHAIFLSSVVGIILAAIGVTLIDPVFSMMGAGPEHMPFIRAFMTISLWGYVFITLPLAGNAAMRAGGDTFTPSLIMMSVAVINIPLSWALVFGEFGLPAWGVAGAATANVIANGLAALLCLLVLFHKHVLDRAHVSLMNLGASARKLFAIAVPVGLTNLMTPLVAGFITTLLATSGPSAVAAYGIITRVEAMIAVVLMAVSIGMGPIIGQCFGARKFDRIEETIRLAIITCIAWSFLTGLVLMFAGPMIAREFTTDITTIHITGIYFLIIGVSSAIMNVAVGWGSAWNAMGKPQIGAGLMVVRHGVGNILFGYVGHMIAGWYGLFIGLAISNLLCGLALHLYSASLFDKIKRS